MNVRRDEYKVTAPAIGMSTCASITWHQHEGITYESFKEPSQQTLYDQEKILIAKSLSWILRGNYGIVTFPMALLSFAKASTWKNSGNTCSVESLGIWNMNKVNNTVYSLLHWKRHSLRAYPLTEKALS